MKRNNDHADHAVETASERVLELAAQRARKMLDEAAASAAETLDKSAKERRSWHIGRDVPLAVIAAVVLQTAGGIWWMAQLSSKIESQILMLAEFKADRYTKDDWRRDRELIEQKLAAQIPFERDIERRVLNLENRIDRMQGK